MSDLKDILREEYEKNSAELMDPHALMTLIEEAMSNLSPLIVEGGTRSASGRETRSLRLPPLVATETTVGQAPQSEDAQIFRQWMSHIDEVDADGSTNAVAAKIKALTASLNNPEKHLKGASIPKTLSYIMFLDQFVWILTEFNASVGGFLWEPLLAALFGHGYREDKEYTSRQVHTREHDIADIRVYLPNQPNSPVSLKVLGAGGDVGGSFVDLASHFQRYASDPDANMRYIVAIKEKGQRRAKKGEEEGESVTAAVQFYEFNIDLKTVWNWIGHGKFEEKVKESAQTFTLSRRLPKFIKFGPASIPDAEDKQRGALADKPGPAHRWMWIRSHSTAKEGEHTAVRKNWKRLADYDKSGRWKIDQKGAAALKLEGDTDGAYLDPDQAYTINIVEIGAAERGGKGGYSLSPEWEEIPFSETKERKKIWGDEESFRYWHDLALAVTPQEFWDTVANKETGPPGFKGNEQFKIKKALYERSNDLGKLSISPQKVKQVFDLGAKNIGEDMTLMFNSMAALTDNIGRFFLTDCGGGEKGPKKCTSADSRKRNTAGRTAMQNAHDLETTVVKTISSIDEK